MGLNPTAAFLQVLSTDGRLQDAAARTSAHMRPWLRRTGHHKKGESLTEVLQCLLNLLGREVNVGIRRNEGGMKPVVVVITVDGVSS